MLTFPLECLVCRQVGFDWRIQFHNCSLSLVKGHRNRVLSMDEFQCWSKSLHCYQCHCRGQCASLPYHRLSRNRSGVECKRFGRDSALRVTLRFIQGLLVASSLAYILPALCYLKLKPYSSPWSMDSICPHILLIIGISLTISGFVLPLRHALQDGYYCQHGIEPAYCTRMFPSSVNHTIVRSAIGTRTWLSNE